ncbi:MAG: hypothetical protein IT356_01585 [Gemmatimonadaceae bacterium]|nr:hypothetical protein [Gemmatimonadaceae bacterium]
MPVAVRLSRNFYERFGDDATNELIALLNDVDFTYRTELKDAFAGSLAVFDAKLEQRIAEATARFDARFAEVEARFDARLAEIEARFDKRFTAIEGRSEQRFAAVDLAIANLAGEMKGMQSSLLRWMFAFWVASTAATISAMAAFAH